MPVTMVEVRMFSDSSVLRGLVTLKYSLPDSSVTSSLLDDFFSSTLPDEPSFTTLVPSRLIYAQLLFPVDTV